MSLYLESQKKSKVSFFFSSKEMYPIHSRTLLYISPPQLKLCFGFAVRCDVVLPGLDTVSMNRLLTDSSFTPISSSSPQPLSSQCLIASFATSLRSFYRKKFLSKPGIVFNYRCYELLFNLNGMLFLLLLTVNTKVLTVFHKNSQHTKQSEVDVYVYTHCRSKSIQPPVSSQVVERYFKRPLESSLPIYWDIEA